MFILLAFLIPFLGIKGTIWLLLFASIIGYVYYSIKKKQSYWSKKGVKHLKPKFFVGNLEIIRSKSFADTVKEIYNNFPEERYHGAYQFTIPTLVIKDSDLIKQITVKEFDHFVNHREFASGDADPFFTRNLLASRDERWKDLRSTLSPSFTSNKMRLMYNLIQKSANQFVDHFKIKDNKITELEMKDTMTRFANDVIATTAFGLEVNSLKDQNNDFYLMGKDATNFGIIRSMKIFMNGISPFFCKLFKVKIIPSRVANYFSKIIVDTVKTRKENNIMRPDMIHLLIEAQKGRQHYDDKSHVNEGFSSVEEFDLTKNKRKQEITIDDICSQAFIFFLAGFETVSTFLSFACYELAIHKDIQDRLRKEILSISGDITYEALLNMKYLDMVVSEVLRKWPPAIFTDRQVTKDFTIEPKNPGEKPLLLEKGTVCWFPMIAYHHDERFFPNPEKFDPERFNDDNKHKINLSMYMPFGAGPRNCIGSRFALLETKLLLFHILKNFELVTISKTLIPMVLDKKRVNLTAEGGMWLGLKKT